MPETSALCAARYDQATCGKPAQVLTWCRYHWRQQHEGRPFTEHRPRRAPGSAALRDAQGRKMCGRCREWRPLGDFTPSAAGLDGLQTWCSPCASDAMTVRRYGITRAQMLDMLEDQGGCAICGTAKPRNAGFRNGWHIDHDHKCCPTDLTCGKCIRGVLCADCNKVLGLVGDSVTRLEQAIAYLQRTGLRDCEARHEGEM